jgi:hypothetical protein
MLALGGGLLFLFANGSAPAFGSTSLAVAAVLIWVTRRSMDNNEYRGY